MAGRVDIMLHLGHSIAGVIRLKPSPIALLTPLARSGGAVCFVAGATPEKKKMEKHDDEEQHTDSDNTYQGDAMSYSFGEGYSTRSEWEGFGGIYDRNPSDISYPEYDKAQGSEVKEKEAPNQPHDES